MRILSLILAALLAVVCFADEPGGPSTYPRMRVCEAQPADLQGLSIECGDCPSCPPCPDVTVEAPVCECDAAEPEYITVTTREVVTRDPYRFRLSGGWVFGALHGPEAALEWAWPVSQRWRPYVGVAYLEGDHCYSSSSMVAAGWNDDEGYDDPKPPQVVTSTVCKDRRDLVGRAGFSVGLGKR